MEISLGLISAVEGPRGEEGARNCSKDRRREYF